ncbi:hypothetical protein [Paucisalibacillus sp. EB02]|uniref:hypothetical protein n=1 Tax=Paucisalibacillus sp. EB02 TaxID=1347087 RepID=UPI0004B80CD0|nr:hypothetical protein [Paucisalibacillus sp. EB02]
MKAIVFQGQSQYDVLRTFSSFYTQQLQEYGIEAITCDMNIIDSKMYLELVEKMKPDFTIGFNPVTYFYENNLNHYQKTKIPHIVKLGDNPFYHVFQRALKNPNDPYVFTVAPQKTYQYSFNELGVERFCISSHNYAQTNYKVGFNNKIFPTVFFGSFTYPESILLKLKEVTNSNQIYKIVNDFCFLIKEIVVNMKELLSEPIEIFFSNYLEKEYKLEKNQITKLTLQVFYYIDSYYRNLVRQVVLTEFAKEGLEMIVFGREDTEKLLSEYSNVKIQQPINYHEYINVLSQSKVSVNITPMFQSSHERIPTTLFNSTVLCTNIMDDLIQNNPGILESSIFYNLSNLKETVNAIKEVSENENVYQELIDKGLILAKQNFTFERDIKLMLDIYQRYFN